MLLCLSLVHSTPLSTCYCLTCLTLVLFPSFIFPERGQVRRGTSGFTTSIVISVTDTAMSSSGCCHLPGSLCDYSGNAESDTSKDSEESDSTTQAQYIAKVTAKDGRPLSTVVKAVSLQRSEGEELARDSNQHTVESLCFFHRRSVSRFSAVTWACVGFATKELEEKPCSRLAIARARWGKCTKAAWRSGCPPPTPATVNSVTQNSLLNEGHSRSHRSARLAPSKGII